MRDLGSCHTVSLNPVVAIPRQLLRLAPGSRTPIGSGQAGVFVQHSCGGLASVPFYAMSGAQLRRSDPAVRTFGREEVVFTGYFLNRCELAGVFIW